MKSIFQKHWKLLAGVIAAPVVIFVGWLALGGSLGRSSKETMPPSTVGQRPVGTVVITSRPVEFRRVERTTEAVGTLHAFEEVIISARVEGRVQQIFHDKSDRVKAGELLLQLDPVDLDLAATQAERSLQVELARLGLKEPPKGNADIERVPAVVQARVKMEQAERRLDRIKKVTDGTFSSEEIDSRTSDFRSATAEYESQLLQARVGLATIAMRQESQKIAQQQLRDASVRVPAQSRPIPGIDGETVYAITSRSVAEGTYVRPGAELFRLVIDGTLKLRAMIPERFSRHVREGQKASVFVAAAEQPVLGLVSRVNPEVNASTRNFDVEVLVANPGRQIKSGSFAKTSIIIGEEPSAAVVPLEAVVRFAGVTKIFLVEDDKAKEVPVTLGVQGETWVQITSPKLPQGARVVTSGQSVLSDGAPVSERASGKDAAP